MTGHHRTTPVRLPDPAVPPPRTFAGSGLSTDPLPGDRATLQTLTCVTAGGDQCGQDCWGDWDYQPRWATDTAALADVATQEWQVTGARLVCRCCAAVLACRAHGHEFGSWRDCGCQQRILDHRACPDGSCGVQWRTCQRCKHADERLTPGAGGGQRW